MRWALTITLAVLFAAAAGVQEPDRQPRESGPGFEAIDVVVDAGAEQLGAYQVEVRANGATLVGVEGGEGAYAAAPYYDPAALHGGGGGGAGERIVLAAFSTAGQLPSGRVRVARLHVQTDGQATYRATVMAAGAAEGQRIEAKATVQRTAGDGR